MTEPKPGDRFRIKQYVTKEQVNADRTIGGPSNGVWIERFFSLGGKVFNFIKTSVDGEYYHLKGEEGMWWFDPGWVEPADQSSYSVVPVCHCDLTNGCTCGAMVAEMAARGLVKDPWSGLYVKKAK